jgi:hypothetical protein
MKSINVKGKIQNEKKDHTCKINGVDLISDINAKKHKTLNTKH